MRAERAPVGLERLMAGYQAGEARAFVRLYAALAPRLHAHFVSLGAPPHRLEDLVQTTFLEMHRARRSYDPSSPFLPWVVAIAGHVLRRAEASGVAAPVDPGGLIGVAVL